MNDRVVDSLRAVVGAEHVLVDADVRAGYEVDWSGTFGAASRCVVRPADVQQVVEVVQVCAAAGAAVVPQGGNTGLVGGSVPRGGEVLLSTRRLTSLGDIDAAAMQVTAGAGVTIEALQLHARAAGVDFAVDWGARSSATVGGAVSTNAGGSRVVRFGTMRAQVVGLQAVLADGSVIGSLDGLPKETTGPDMSGLFVGGEGVFGVVTAARLRVVPWYRHTAAALVAVSSLDDAVDLLHRLRGVPSLDAVELLLPEALSIACTHLGVAPPLDPRSAMAFVMVDCAALHDPTDELAALVDGSDGVMAIGPQRDRLYRIRDHITVAIAAQGRPVKLDVAVPVRNLQTLIGDVRAAIEVCAPSGELVAFGHLAEGNVHVNVLGVPDGARLALTDAVLGAAVRLGGTISAEHGIGVAKAEWLERAKGAEHVRALRAVKAALDPQGIMNPGVLLPRRAAPA